MTRMLLLVLLVAALAVGTAGSAADLRLPLDLRPHGGSAGMRFVSNGVPLLPGQAMSVDELQVIDAGGRPVPAQFRVLARWWRQDSSIRWVLVDFQRTDAGEARPIYTLVRRAEPARAPASTLSVTEDDEYLRVSTGVALFEISKRHFNLFNRVLLDCDGDGEFEEGETVVSPDPRLGSVVEDPHGIRYYSSLGTSAVILLERGPVAVKVLAKGSHVSREEGAFTPGLYGYEIYLTFHAGQPYCNVDAILTNNFATPIGEPHFEDWSLVTRIGAGGQAWRLGLRSDVDLSGEPPESALLYQDSVGSEHWETNTGIEVRGWPKPPRPELSTFRGYKLWRVRGANRHELAHGDSADGVAACETGEWGCTVSPRYFWQQFPSALQFGGDGIVRLSPFPGEYKSVHWLEDATAKAQEFQLCFYPAQKEAGAEALARADEFQRRVFAFPSPEHCGKAGALSDLGPYLMHPKIAEAAGPDVYFSLSETENRLLSTDSGYGNGYGWQVFGMRWFEMAGHSPWNYEPIATSGSLWTHLLNRNPDRLEWGLRVARHARDVRAYYVEGQDNLALWTTWEKYWETCVIEHFSRLVRGPVESDKARVPDTGEHPYPRERWPLPNMSHVNLDEVYDLYLLTGDYRALRAMQTIADHGMAWILLQPGARRVYRDEGWCLRAVARYYELTGDPRYEAVLKACIDRIWQDVNKAGPVSENAGTWYQAIYARGAIVAWLATGDERMRDLALGCAEWAMTYEVTPEGYPAPGKPEPWLLTPEERVGPKGEIGQCPAWANGYHIDLYAWAYQQTGDPKYLEAMDFAWEKNREWWWLGYFPAAMYMAYGPRPDKLAPSAVTDLRAEAGTGEVALTWTAPGDDGDTGAAAYQIKYATKPMLEFVTWPDKRESHINFWGATNVADEPKPGPAGRRETFTISGLPAGTYYFAMKSRDEWGNQSALSNVVRANVTR